MQRTILHVDMDEFFAAVERRDGPSLRGKPLLVGGDAKARGVVSTASYEARVYGCRSAMPMARAIRLCPKAVVLPVRMERYEEVSRQIFDIFLRFTPQIEPLSIDEAFLDVTGSRTLHGDGIQIARKIKDAIRQELGLTASVGVAENKFLAKLASDLKKPDGLAVIMSADVQKTLEDLPVRKLWGVGPAVENQLDKLNIHTIDQLRRADQNVLIERMGDMGRHLHELSQGIDDRSVESDFRAKSIGQEETFAVDIDDRQRLKAVLLGQVEQVARRLRIAGMRAKTITIKLRHGDFTTMTRSATLPTATDVTELLWRQAVSLFEKWAKEDFHSLRLIGATASSLCDSAGQLNLFAGADADSEKLSKLDRATDAIIGKFGKSAIRRGTSD